MMEALPAEQRRLLRLLCEAPGATDERRVIVALLDVLDGAESFLAEVDGAVDRLAERCERAELSAETWSARAVEAEIVLRCLEAEHPDWVRAMRGFHAAMTSTEPPMPAEQIERWLETGEGPQPPSTQCPICGIVSFNVNDIAEGYCGRCHVFHQDQASRPGTRSR